jgi:hypothetical protein
LFYLINAIKIFSLFAKICQLLKGIDCRILQVQFSGILKITIQQVTQDCGYLPGTDVMILKIFSPENLAKKIGVFYSNKAKLCKSLIIALVFEKNAKFFAENCQKSQKIVIITSTPVSSFIGYA